MALIPAQSVAVSGTTLTLTAASVGGDTARTGKGQILVVENADASSKTVTLVTPGNLPTGDAYPDKAITVAADDQVLIPLLAVYRDPTDGVAHITYSDVTSVTVGAISA